jgi:hypothetical protein
MQWRKIAKKAVPFTRKAGFETGANVSSSREPKWVSCERDDKLRPDLKEEEARRVF